MFSDSVVFNNIYKGKKVFITGHTGFKGSWLTIWLLMLGAEVTGYSLEPCTSPNLFNILGLESKINHIIGDVLDSQKLENSIQKSKAEFIFHLAAQPLVRVSYLDPKNTYETNIIGTLNLFEAARKIQKLKVLINVTSDKCYENKEWYWGYRETDRIGGYDPYSSSKGISEILTSAYRNSYFNHKNYGITHNLSIATARSGNVIGGGDFSQDRLVPDCIRAIIEKKILAVRNPDSIRPWQHVLETISGYLWLGAKMYENSTEFSEAWNFGPDDEKFITVKEIIESIKNSWKNFNYEIIPDEKMHETSFLKLDPGKARVKLGWSSIYTSFSALDKAVEWYKFFYNSDKNIFDFTKYQIYEYCHFAQAKNAKWISFENFIYK